MDNLEGMRASASNFNADCISTEKGHAMLLLSDSNMGYH